MAKIYFPYTFGLHPQFLDYSSPKPWNFLSVKSDESVFCYINEVTFGKHPRVGLVVIRGLELSVPCPDLWGGEGGWRLRSITSS